MADWATISAGDSFDDDLGGGLEGYGVEFRRARIFASGSFENNVFFKAQYDLAGGDADFKDMYIGMKKSRHSGTLKDHNHHHSFQQAVIKPPADKTGGPGKQNFFRLSVLSHPGNWFDSLRLSISGGRRQGSG